MSVGYVLDRWVELSQTFVVEEVKELRRQGVTVEVLALHRGSAPSLPDVPARFLRDSPAGFANLWEHLRWAALRPDRYLRFLLAVRRHREEAGEMAWKRLPWSATQLRRAGVDRLHAHFAWAGASAAEALSALTGWPWVLTVHARDIYAPRAGLRSKLDSCAALVTVCDYNVAFLQERLDVRRAITKVVCGVTPPDPWVPKAATMDVVAVGRLVEKKGFDVLLRAVARVNEVIPARLMLVGEGPARPELEALREELHLEDHVTFAGARAHEEVLAIMGAAKVLCLPARVARDGDADSMPLVVKEAMVRAVPVVVTPVGGLPELVDDRVGLVVPPDDVAALTEALVTLLCDDDLRRGLGAAGRQRILDGFTLAGEVSLLRDVLGNVA